MVSQSVRLGNLAQAYGVLTANCSMPPISKLLNIQLIDTGLDCIVLKVPSPIFS